MIKLVIESDNHLFVDEAWENVTNFKRNAKHIYSKINIKDNLVNNRILISLFYLSILF